MHSKLDHSLASSEDGPGVGMHMVVLEGRGGVVPTAAVYKRNILKENQKQKHTFVNALSFINLNLVQQMRK